MIYIICRNKNEIKYEIPNNCKIIINDGPLYLGEIGAWDKIYNDAKNNGYDKIGIYQSRRIFHNNKTIMLDNDFIIDDSTVYLSKYNLKNETIVEQYKKNHPNYKELFELVTPKEYKDILNIHYIHPHNMFYCSFYTFEQLYFYIKFIINCAVIKPYYDRTEKFFSFLSERITTIWFIKNIKNIKISNVLTYDKKTGKILYTIDGIDN